MEVQGTSVQPWSHVHVTHQQLARLADLLVLEGLTHVPHAGAPITSYIYLIKVSSADSTPSIYPVNVFQTFHHAPEKSINVLLRCIGDSQTSHSVKNSLVENMKKEIHVVIDIALCFVYHIGIQQLWSSLTPCIAYFLVCTLRYDRFKPIILRSIFRISRLAVPHHMG
jgi:hypothetical protein